MDPAERRGGRFKGPLEGNMSGAQKPVYVSTLQQRIAELAREQPEMAFTSLAHLIDIFWLHEAYNRTRKDGAAGVDGQTGKDYEANLEGNLQSLLDRAKSGTYVAPPVRRVHIPNAGSTHEAPAPRRGRPRRPAPSGYPPSKIKCFRGGSPWSWRRSTSRTSWAARTASGP